MFKFLHSLINQIFNFKCWSNPDDISESSFDNISQIAITEKNKGNEVYYIDYDEISDITWEDSE